VNDFVRIAVLENQFEAQLVEAACEERQLPCRIRSFHDTAYDGLFQFQKGWGELRAPEHCRAELLQILQNIRQSDGASPH
jgi:hypothetical protein